MSLAPTMAWCDAAMTDQNPYGQPPVGDPGRPPAPYGQPYGQQPYGQQPYGQPYGQQPVWPVGRDPHKRPGTVTAAAIITIVLSALVLVLGLLVIVVGAADSQEFYDSFREGSGGTYDDISDEDIRTVLMVAGGVLAVWSAAGVLLGVLVLRRSSVGRILLVISAVMTALFSLIAILSIASVITLIAGIAVTIMLFTGGANDWFARRP